MTPWTVVHQAPLSMEFSRQKYWSGLPFPSPGDLPTQGLNPSLLHCRQILYHLSHQGSLILHIKSKGHPRAGSLKQTNKKTCPKERGYHSEMQPCQVLPEMLFFLSPVPLALKRKTWVLAGEKGNFESWQEKEGHVDF